MQLKKDGINLKEEKKRIIIIFIIIYTLFGFFPGVRIKYFSGRESLIMRNMDYFIRNFIHLWNLKIIATIVFMIISFKIMKKKTDKYKR